MNISFYLNTQLKTKHGDHPVYMYITYEGKRIRKPVSKVHASEQYWDEAKQRIKRPPKADAFDETKSFNKRLEFIEAQIKVIDQEAFDRRIKLTEQYIIERLMDESLVKIDQFDFFKAADQYLQSIKSVKAERTITGKKTVFNFLKEYQTETRNELTFHHMNIQFFEELRNYAFEKKKIGDNYFAKIIAVLKTFLHWAFERDYIKHESFKKFQAPERESEIICLTLDEFVT
ncbi:MAG: phage integrase SAM-like domain-containing protein, partial [Flammeovirgaceae bacterium]